MVHLGMESKVNLYKTIWLQTFIEKFSKGKVFKTKCLHLSFFKYLNLETLSVQLSLMCCSIAVRLYPGKTQLTRWMDSSALQLTLSESLQAIRRGFASAETSHWNSSDLQTILCFSLNKAHKPCVIISLETKPCLEHSYVAHVLEPEQFHCPGGRRAVWEAVFFIGITHKYTTGQHLLASGSFPGCSFSPVL